MKLLSFPAVSQSFISRYDRMQPLYNIYSLFNGNKAVRARSRLQSLNGHGYSEVYFDDCLPPGSGH